MPRNIARAQGTTDEVYRSKEGGGGLIRHFFNLTSDTEIPLGTRGWLQTCPTLRVEVYRGINHETRKVMWLEKT